MKHLDKLQKLENIQNDISDMIHLRCAIERKVKELGLEGELSLPSGCNTLSDTLYDVRELIDSTEEE